MSFWEVSVDHARMAEERSSANVLFHVGLDSSFSMSAMVRHQQVRMLCLGLMLATITLVSFLVARVEPRYAITCFLLAALFANITISERLARLFSVRMIENAWVQRFSLWYEESGIADEPDPEIDLEYIREVDPRLDVVMERLNLGPRVNSGTWVQKDSQLYPSVLDLKFFIRYWSQRSLSAVLAFLLAGVLILLGYEYAGGAIAITTAAYALVLLLSKMLYWNRSASSMLRYMQLFHSPEEMLSPQGIVFGMVTPATLNQLGMALENGSEQRVRFWTRCYLQELLQIVDPYLYPDLLRDTVEPRLEQWYGKPLCEAAREEIANFERE